MAQPSDNIFLHIWPQQWDLPSFDPSCLAAIAYLQLAIPGKFSIVECSNPDLSPTGQLPFLVHDQHTVTTLALIIKYVAGLKKSESFPNANLEAPLDQMTKSQSIAWCAHVEANIGDIVYHTMFSHHGNWAGLTGPALASVFPVPQRYYVPARMRESYRPRLEAAGLWNLPDMEKEEKKPFKEDSKKKVEKNTHVFLQAFEREKVMEKARASFDIYTRLLGDREYFYQNRPTTLDIILAAHILLLISPTYPDPFIKNLVTESYSTLATHAHRVYGFRSSELTRCIPTAPKFSWRSLIPTPPAARKQPKKTEEDIHYDRMRWGFIGLAVGSLAAYIVVVGGSRFLAIKAALEKQEAEGVASDGDE